MARSFSTLQEQKLYGPGGFYERPGSGPGRNRDFITSPELGTVFAELLSVAMDRWWQEAGSPERYVFVEAGAGRGALASAVLRQPMECSAALQYVTVERSRQRRSELLDVLGTSAIVSAELPDDADVIFANELLDNIPVDIAAFDGSCWREVLFDDELVPADLGSSLDVDCDAPAGSHAPVQWRQAQWVTEAAAKGKVVVVDYTSTTAAMAADSDRGWLRTYKAHARRMGDMTCDVAVDQLPMSNACTQAEWLRTLGVDALRTETQGVVDASLAEGGLDSVRARSRLGEIDALLDPKGLGGFSVLEWPTP